MSAIDVEALGRWIRAFAADVSLNKELLTQLDSAIGDADHGANMDRGMAAAVAAIDGESPAFASVGAVLKTVGLTLVSAVGGASGPLYGTLFLRMAAAAGEEAVLDGPGFSRALDAGLAGVVARGKAEPGDKTMYDALAPACATLDAALAEGADLGAALAAAAASADAGRDATIPMLAHKGRASYLGERSVGHQDPGATSAALLVHAAATTLAEPGGQQAGGGHDAAAGGHHE
jgi:phosphoenolpyruvate---glycerone phosphotransferase subunit DhaL